jgi:hypothetical protein
VRLAGAVLDPLDVVENKNDGAVASDVDVPHICIEYSFLR